MFNKSINKVKFQDSQLDDYELENSVLKSKLQSKLEALSIMSKQLDKCCMERDKYKVLVEQLRYKKPLPLKSQDGNGNMYRFTPSNSISGGEMLAKTRDQNTMLKLEVELLHSKLEEATGDIVALRTQLQKRDSYMEYESGHRKSDINSNKEYEQLVQALEKIQKKYQQIQLDYRATLDEKEELVTDRDYYKDKVHRLNHQISYILSNRAKVAQSPSDTDTPKPIVDIDALVTENKYLHERITQLQIEKEIIKRTLSKYKTLLDNRNKSSSYPLKKGFIDVMTQSQAREFLDTNMKGSKQSSVAEMKSLCLGLFEALNDKSVALQHQRKTNQILASRITELEKTLESWCNGHKYIPIFPSQMLLDESFPDAGSRSDETKEDTVTRSQDNDNKVKYSDSDEDTRDNDDSSNDDGNSEFVENRNIAKTILPRELEELVNEALAELKPAA